QRLTAAGLPMVEFPQSVPNLTEASTNLYEIIKGRNLIAYPDPDLRLAISRAGALETTRGWRIAKEKQAHKIDVVVALAQAALGAVKGAGLEPGWLGFLRHEGERTRGGWVSCGTGRNGPGRPRGGTTRRRACGPGGRSPRCR